MNRAFRHSTMAMTLLLPTMPAPRVPVMTMPPAARARMNTMVQTMMPALVQTMLTGVPDGTVSLGASLRDRASLPSPLRGLGPSGGYPSRLRSLRSLRAPACPAARYAHRRCRTDTPGVSFDRTVHGTAVSSSR